MHWLRILARLPLDFALPRRCAGCGDVLGGQGAFCLSCWTSLTHLPTEGCLCCFAPVAVPGSICAPCLQAKPQHDGVLAAVAYGPISRDLVLRLKYGRRPGCAQVMAGLLAARASLLPEALLIPVPLHRWRLWWRGFNQSQLIAKAIARQTRQEVRSDVLLRRKRTRALGGLSRQERAKEVRVAFTIAADKRAVLKGRDVLLVDDVYTSGATTNGCAHLLKRAGAARVFVLCWSRVLQDAV